MNLKSNHLSPFFEALVRMRAFHIRHFAQEAVVKHLKTHMVSEGDQIKECKEPPSISLMERSTPRRPR